MERLPCSDAAAYRPIEAAIHVSRYAGALALCPGRRVLDIACGEGYGSFLMAQAGAAEVVGIDVSAEAIAASARQFPHPRLRFLAGDAGDLDPLLGDARFDLIVSLETVEHLGDPIRFLKGIRRRCADGGTVILSCPNDHWYYTPDQRNPYHIRKYSFAEFRSLAEEFLGAADAWYFGTAAFGFATLPAEGPAVGRTGADYADARRAPAAFLCRPGSDDQVALDRSSYFLGVWGPGAADAQGAAFFPLSMDRYASLFQSGALASALANEAAARRQLAESLQAAEAALRQQQQEAAACLAEARRDAAAALEQARRELREAHDAARQVERQLAEERLRAEQALRLGRVQVHALRKENAILFDSVARLRAAAEQLDRERAQREQLAAENARLQAEAARQAAVAQARHEHLAADHARLLEERDFLLAERERIFARMRPIWRLAQMIPPPVRRTVRRVAGPVLRRLAPQA